MSMISNALSGAQAAQAGLNTTSQNIANQLTAGYTRQSVDLVSLAPGVDTPLSAGSGVDVVAIRRMSDSYKTLTLWQTASVKGRYDTMQQYLGQVESVMGSEGSSLSTGLDNLFKAFGAVSVNPTSDPLYDAVVTSAGALSQRFNYQNQVLASQRTTLHEQRSVAVDQINTLTRDIAELNRRIVLNGSQSGNPSALLDTRDQKIDQLAALVDVQVIGQPSGVVCITLKNGQPLVVDGAPSTMKVLVQSDGSQQLGVDFAQESFKLDGSVLGGQLGGLNHYESDVLTPMVGAIQSMGQELATRINTKLAAGFNRNGQPGKPLFVFDLSNPQGMLTVNPGLNGRDLAFSKDPAKPGDSSNLASIIATQTEKATIPGLGAVSLNDAYAQLIGQLGLQSQQNKASQGTAGVVRAQAEKDWKASSAVNRDEEAMNLIQYQQMYTSNMKVISVAGQLFESTLSILG